MTQVHEGSAYIGSTHVNTYVCILHVESTAFLC